MIAKNGSEIRDGKVSKALQHNEIAGVIEGKRERTNGPEGAGYKKNGSEIRDGKSNRKRRRTII